MVSEVYSESPAERAGLRPGDRVLSVNGRAVENYMQLLRRVAFLPPGSKATLEVERERGREEIAVTLAERPAQRTPVVPAGALSDVLGLFLRDTTTDVQKNLGHEPRSGALVAGVAPRSAAERAGLRPGDLITEANRRPVRSAEDFREVVRADEARGTVLVRFKRGDAVRYVALSGR